MAIGLARMFNVRFPLNFNSPYKARVGHRLLAALAHDADALPEPVPVRSDGARAIARRAASARPVDARKAQATPRGFAAMVLLPIFVTMVLAGIWHGAA